MKRLRLAILRCHVAMLALAIPDLRRWLPLATLLWLFTPRRTSRLYSGIDPAEIVRVVERRLHRPWRMRRRPCLRLGLLLFHFLRLAGVPAVLNFCVYKEPLKEPLAAPSLGREQAHCWVTVSGRCVASPPESEHVVILVYGEGSPDGHRVAA